jgi:hypothetical protein
MSGCDLMVCGRDYHGNSLGLGCGESFCWSQAPMYRPSTGNESVVTDMTLVEPTKVLTNSNDFKLIAIIVLCHLMCVDEWIWNPRLLNSNILLLKVNPDFATIVTVQLLAP